MWEALVLPGVLITFGKLVIQNVKIELQNYKLLNALVE